MENSNIVTDHATLVAIAAEDIHAQQGEPTTTSLQVAARFKKHHHHVMRAIKNIVEELPPEHQTHFGFESYEVKIAHGATRQSPMYRMTKDGFSLLAMGFTGKEALHWKLAYIAAFNRMAATLSRYVSFGVPATMYARALEAEKQEAGSFAKASVAGRTLSLRRMEKKAFQSIVKMVRAEVQLQLLLGNTTN